MSLADYCGLFGTLMIFILLIWDRVSIFLLMERISVLEKKLCHNGEQSDKHWD